MDAKYVDGSKVSALLDFGSNPSVVSKARYSTSFLKRQDVVFGVQVDSNTPTTLAALHGRKDATWRHERFDVKRFVVTCVKRLEARYHIEHAW